MNSGGVLRGGTARQVVPHEAGWRLRDLGSTNGIFVGNEQVKTALLEHLSEFRIGATTLMFTVTAME